MNDFRLILKEADIIFRDIFERKKTREDVFYDLCFVLTVAQTPFKTTKEAIDDLRKENFMNKNLSLGDVLKILSSIRFKNRKASFLLMMKKDFSRIYSSLFNDYLSKNGDNLRSWLVDNITGLGMKTASHFLRNQGYRNFAIIDSHILKFLREEKPTSKKQYLRLEEIFFSEANYYQVEPAILDLAIWKHQSNTPWKDVTY